MLLAAVFCGVDRAASKVDGGKRTKAVSIEEAEEER